MRMFQLARIGSHFASRRFSTAAQTAIILTGAPGVGKGTFGKRLAKDLNLTYFAMGDYLRALLKNENTTDPAILKMQQGELVTDDIICGLFEKAVPPHVNCLLDGFPRTIGQAEWLKNYMNINLVLNFHMDREILVKLMAGRRVCLTSGHSYNIFEMREGGYDLDPLLPKKDPLRCDVSGELLVQREDDSFVRKRLEEYDAQTAPLLDYYSGDNNLFTMEPKRGVKDYPNVLEQTQEYLQQVQSR